MKKYNCLHCSSENIWGHSKVNKFCNNICQGEYKWQNETVPRIERGECTHNSATDLKKYLVETRGEKCEDCGQLPTHNNKPLVL